MAGRVNCVEQKAGIVLETPKSAFAHQKQGCYEKLPERRKSEKKRYGLVDNTAHLMHHRIPGLRLETAPYPIFGPPCGLRAHLLYNPSFHVSTLFFSLSPWVPLSP